MILCSVIRHTYASIQIHQGENIKFVQSQLGHASSQMTIDRYGHLFPIDYAGAGVKIDEQVFDNVSKPYRATVCNLKSN